MDKENIVNNVKSMETLYAAAAAKLLQSCPTLISRLANPILGGEVSKNLADVL